MPPKKKKPATGVTLSWDEERYPDGPPIPITVKPKSLKETLNYIGVIATAKNRLRGQIKKGDSEDGKKLQERAAKNSRHEAEFGENYLLDDKWITWYEYWEKIYDGLPPNQKFKKTADERTANAGRESKHGRKSSTIKKWRLNHPELSKP